MAKGSLPSCTVYLGSSAGSSLKCQKAVESYGALLAASGTALVFGGGKRGLMGTIADAVLKEGGHVIGIIPTFLANAELLHPGCHEVEMTDTMRERKQRLIYRGAALVGLPGGFGTFEEMVEVIALANLGQCVKPIGLLNVEGFFTPLLELLQRAARDGLFRQEVLHNLVVEEEPEKLHLKLAERFRPENASGFVPLPFKESQAVDNVVRSSTESCAVFISGGTENASHVPPCLFAAAEAFGRLLAEEGIELVCAADQHGLSGTMASSAIAAGGRVVGVVPASRRNHPSTHKGLTELHVVDNDSTYALNQGLFERGNWLVALPGDANTWDAILEVLSHGQLGKHQRVMGVLNTDGFYSPLIRLLENSVKFNFVQREFLTYLVSAETPKEFLNRLRDYAPTRVLKRVFAKPQSSL